MSSQVLESWQSPKKLEIPFSSSKCQTDFRESWTEARTRRKLQPAALSHRPDDAPHTLRGRRHLVGPRGRARVPGLSGKRAAAARGETCPDPAAPAPGLALSETWAPRQVTSFGGPQGSVLQP